MKSKLLPKQLKHIQFLHRTGGGTIADDPPAGRGKIDKRSVTGSAGAVDNQVRRNLFGDFLRPVFGGVVKTALAAQVNGALNLGPPL